MKINRLTFNYYDFWLLLMLFLSSGALVYYFYALDWLGIGASLLITGFMYYALRPSLRHIIPSSDTHDRDRLGIISGLASLALAIIAIVIAFRARTDMAIITPWTEVSPWFFVVLGLSALTLIITLSRNISSVFNKILLFSFFISIFCIAAIVYRLGYGFDPFIHQAAMAEISRYGFIFPKTPYYLGQYSLVAFLDKMGLSVFYVNQWLLPLLSSLSLAFLLPFLHRGRRQKAAAWIASLCLILLGFSPLIMTTPQNFSYLLLLITVIFLYKKAPWSLSVTTAIATFAVHPLAGLPALFLTIWILSPQVLPRIEKWRVYRKPAYILGAAIAAFSLSIWAIAGFSPLQLQSYNLGLLMPVLTNQETYALDLSYFTIKNYFWLLLAAAVLIFFKRGRLWPEEDSNTFRVAKVLSLTSVAAIIAYLISRGFHFEGLITYEQDDYADRLPIIALIIVIPLFWELFYQASRRALALSRPAKVIAAAGMSLLLLVAVYASYPRFDNYHNSRGYSTSAADVAAVQAAEKAAEGESYIVLANQQVSAAALREYGFRGRYLQVNGDEMYFYPIPTGGPLYQYFLDMVYIKADQETMDEAMTMAGVERAFLIINRYWWASDKIVAEAKLSANSWERLNQGEVHVFEYVR